MASFWSRLQIPGLISPKENGHCSVLLRGSNIMQSAMKENIRTFLFWKSKKPLEYGTGNCGKPAPKKIVEPCKGCPSKCLEEKPAKKRFFSFRKPKVIKEKPSNCEEIKPVEEKLTWWEMIFGSDPKKSWPDPCTCRLAHRQKRMCRARDKRLTDSRYKETAGDVFLYTEVIQRKTRPYEEPQPKPPPSFKVPTAVQFKRMCMDEIALLNREMAKDEGGPIITRPHRIPYEEMRPPEKRREMFSCQRGIRSEDILRPIERDTNFYGTPLPMVQHLNFCKNLEPKKKIPLHETKNDINQTSQKRSRIEQLKFLVQQKDTLRCMSPTS